MICTNCGCQNNHDGSFCVGCGYKLPSIAPNSQFEPYVNPTPQFNPVLIKISNLAKDSLFTAICVFMSIFVGLSFLTTGLNIIGLLATIFLWTIYSNAKKGNLAVKDIRKISGLVYAVYIINYILLGLLLIFGFVLCFFTDYFVSLSSFFWEAAFLSNEPLSDLFCFILYGFGKMPYLILGMIIIFAIGLFVVNIFGFKKIHRFIKSIHTNAQFCTTNYQCVNAAKNWLMAIGIIQILTLANFFNSIFLNAILGVIEILCSILIKKYFMNTNNTYWY